MTKYILYLASGSSRRFGENKLLFPIDGKPMFLWGLEMLEDVVKTQEDCRLVVVSRYEQIRREADRRGIPAVDSPESERGISYSIRAGLAALTDIQEDDFVLFVVADQPYLTKNTMCRLLACAKTGAETARVCFKQRPGNPTLFSAKFIPELLSLQGDSGGKSILQQHACVWVEADSEKELEDIDTPGEIRPAE